nr:single-stranded-DNA-specific exonuclease RecJ [Entomobacter blattae]
MLGCTQSQQQEGGGSRYVLNVGSSASHRRWLWRSSLQGDHSESEQEIAQKERLSARLSQQLQISDFLAGLISSRGIPFDEVEDYLSPTLRKTLVNPFLMQEMEKAASRLVQAIKNSETVGIFADYDVDGACAGALLQLVLMELGCMVHIHVPDRIQEGYGPNKEAIENLRQKGATLIVCVDCGTVAGPILNPLLQGGDIVVFDHHKSEELPKVTAVVNPNRPGGDKPIFSNLCAAGVVFMGCIASFKLLREGGFFNARKEPDLKHYLDLVALATVCDVMPLTHMNRALVAQGLKVITAQERVGLRMLGKVAGVKHPYTVTSLGFALGPRINAGGRIGDSSLGVKLLTSRDEEEALQIAYKLDEVNKNRQVIEGDILKYAMEQAEKQVKSGCATILLSGREWHQGVVGIIAGRIKEAFNRPALVGVHLEEEGLIKGSARSVVGLDIAFPIMQAVQAGLLKGGGGHAMAAGFALDVEKQEVFHSFLEKSLKDAVDLPPKPDLIIDRIVSAPALTLNLAEDLAVMAPFGNGNEEPVLAVPYLRVVRKDRIGDKGNTLRVIFSSEGGIRLKGILFQASHSPVAQALEENYEGWWHVVGQLRAEHWNGQKNLSFFIKDATKV